MSRRTAFLVGTVIFLACVVLFASAVNAVDLGPDPAPPPANAPRFDALLSGYLGDPPANPRQRVRYQTLWFAPYFRSLTSGAEWIEGGRDGYRCMWMFLDDPEGNRIGRVTFVGGYGDGAVSRIVDRYADDRDTHLYDGTPFTGAGNESNDCPQFADLGDYFGPAERPTLRFYEIADGSVLEVRSYLTTVFGPNVTVHLHSNDVSDRTVTPPVSAAHTVYQTVIVQGLLAGQEIVNVYYETLDPAYAIDVTPLVVGATAALPKAA